MHLNWFSKSSAHNSRLRFLGTLGHSWSASPIRRLLQSLFFILFLLLFFLPIAPARPRPDPAEFFLTLDPLVSLTTAIASRAWVWSLAFAAAILFLSILLPRVFCGYICPMGTFIDLFDRAIGKRFQRFHLTTPGWFRNLRYFILTAILLAAAATVILTGYFAPIPILTRGLQSIVSPTQFRLTHTSEPIAPMQLAGLFAIALLSIVLLLGLLRPRFWCRHLCPTGAIFSILNLLRITERKVRPECIQCGKCANVCTFDAINDDFTTIGPNCTFCQTCGGVCPVNAIHFTPRLATLPVIHPDTAPTDVSRRAFIIGAAIGAAAGGLAASAIRVARATQLPPILRPPGSVNEPLFNQLCVRCGQCLRVCPTNLLQPAGLQHGLDRLWTPIANADFAGCHPSCNNCGQICPTNAIIPLALDQKKQTRMGLAQVNSRTCLAYQGRPDCQSAGRTSLICRDACDAAAYSAIATNSDTNPIPAVLPDRCVGCGLCQAACYRANVLDRNLLTAAAIHAQPISPQSQSPHPPALAPSTRPAPIPVPYSVPDQ